MRTLIILISITFAFGNSATAQTAPDFEVTDIQGNTHHLYSILADSNYVLIDFFFTDCSYCQFYASHVNQSYKDFGCNKGNVVILGIDYNDDSLEVAHFKQDYQLEYPLISGVGGKGDSVIADYGITAFPTVMIIGPDSNIWKEINTPTTANINDMLSKLGGTLQPCNVNVNQPEKIPDFRVYPNPLDNKLHIHWQEDSGARVQIRSLSGQLVLEQNVNANSHSILNTTHLRPGVYILQINNARHQKSTVIIKQ